MQLSLNLLKSSKTLFSCLGSLQWMRQLQKVWEWLLPSIITKEGERSHGWELEFPKNDFLHLTWLISSPNEWKFSICCKTQNSRKDQSEVLLKKWRFTYTSRQNNADWCINGIFQNIVSLVYISLSAYSSCCSVLIWTGMEGMQGLCLQSPIKRELSWVICFCCCN